MRGFPDESVVACAAGSVQKTHLLLFSREHLHHCHVLSSADLSTIAWGRLLLQPRRYSRVDDSSVALSRPRSKRIPLFSVSTNAWPATTVATARTPSQASDVH